MCSSRGRAITARGIVHVYKDAKLVVKWDLEANVAMKGRPTARVLALLDELKKEGLL